MCLVAVQLARAREHVQFALHDRLTSCHRTHDGAAGAARREPGCRLAFLSVALLFFDSLTKLCLEGFLLADLKNRAMGPKISGSPGRLPIR